MPHQVAPTVAGPISAAYAQWFGSVGIMATEDGHIVVSPVGIDEIWLSFRQMTLIAFWRMCCGRKPPHPKNLWLPNLWWSPPDVLG